MNSYQSVFGGELTVATFAEFHASEDPAEQDKIMHSQLEAPDGFVPMAADTPAAMDYQPQAGTAVSVSGDDQAKLQGYWERLSDSGVVIMPFDNGGARIRASGEAPEVEACTDAPPR